ncbi:MAG: aldo/keto reductase [Actinomycetales bacterium]|nr:aldo/keto reductase [Actinomycetales bacterium]
MMNDGRTIPLIGFGLWQVPDDVAIDATLAALQAGYRHLDTAAVYENERGVGTAIARSGLPRDEIFVTTKVWNTEHGYDQTLAAMDRSLSLLGLDYVDLYLVHWPSPATGDFVQTWRAVLALHEQGKTRSVGVSNFHAHHLERIIDEFGVVPVLDQIELHPNLQQRPLRSFNAAHGILTEAWSPLASGELLADPTIGAIASKHQVSAAQVMIRWHLQLGHVVLPKSVTPERIRQNIDVFGFTLDAQDLAAIAAMDKGQRTGPNPDEFM